MNTHDVESREPGVSSSLFSAYVDVGGHEFDHACQEQQEIPEQSSSGQAEPAPEIASGNTEPAAEPEGKEAAADDARAKEEDAAKRKAHEEAEAKRKAEWEARQSEKKAAVQAQLDQIAAMNDGDLMAASMRRVSADTEKLTRRNMKDCVSEYIQTRCLEDSAFARMVMHPNKSMIRCFQYINRRAREFIEKEMDDLCYQWGEEYFRDPDAKEDHKDDEKFVPRPYMGGRSSSKSKSGTKEKKKTEKKAQKPKETPAPAETSGQISLMEMAS